MSIVHVNTFVLMMNVLAHFSDVQMIFLFDLVFIENPLLINDVGNAVVVSYDRSTS